MILQTHKWHQWQSNYQDMACRLVQNGTQPIPPWKRQMFRLQQEGNNHSKSTHWTLSHEENKKHRTTNKDILAWRKLHKASTCCVMKWQWKPQRFVLLLITERQLYLKPYKLVASASGETRKWQTMHYCVKKTNAYFKKIYLCLHVYPVYAKNILQWRSVPWCKRIQHRIVMVQPKILFCLKHIWVNTTIYPEISMHQKLK